MYSNKIIAKKAAQLEAAFPLKLREYTVDEVEYWVERLKQLVHPDSTENKPKLVRDLRTDEQDFIANEIAMTKISYPYWAPRYAFIKYDKGGVRRLKFAESQEMLLSVLATLEEAGKPAKILNLKARQVYSSTFSETVITHKVMNTAGITSVVASDEPNKSEFMFNMMERIYDNLPFYLKPHKKFRVKGSQLYFDVLDSLIDVDSGNKKVGGIGQGMAQPLQEPILTPTGWQTIGTLRVGDYVIGANGLPTKVIGIYPQGEKENFRVTFTDNFFTECCKDHIWYVESAKDKYKKRLGKTIPLKDLKELKNKNGAHNYFIPVVKPIAFEHKDLVIDPYLLGVLLGDGGLTIPQRIIVTIADETLKREIEKVLPKELSLKKCSGTLIDYRISSSRQLHKNQVLTEIKRLGLSGKSSHTKFIPEEYRFTSQNQREALLQGLLDTDGSVSKADNAVEYFSMSEQLVNGVVELVQSLGGIATKKIRTYKPCNLRNYESVGFVLRIALPTGIKPFKMQRKALVYHDRQKYLPLRAIEKIEALGKTEMSCIAVDAKDQLYITRNYIVTHNTIHSGHLSELATWNNTAQITADLLPAVTSGESPNTFFIIESTANGKHGALYEWWKAAKRKRFYGFVPVFIPWWMMTEKYSTDPEYGWEPSDRVLKLALQIKQTKGIELNRKQMFWWETNYLSYKEGNKLHEFFAEYASDDQEAFQLAGKTVFDTEKLNDMLRRAKTWPIGIYQVEEKVVLR